jgi:hypothetical protein
LLWPSAPYVRTASSPRSSTGNQDAKATKGRHLENENCDCELHPWPTFDHRPDGWGGSDRRRRRTFPEQALLRDSSSRSATRQAPGPSGDGRCDGRNRLTAIQRRWASVPGPISSPERGRFASSEAHLTAPSAGFEPATPGLGNLVYYWAISTAKELQVSDSLACRFVDHRRHRSSVLGTEDENCSGKHRCE